VAQRYDLGGRNGDQIAKDMVAARIGPDHRGRPAPEMRLIGGHGRAA
jgi:hypothetical protein